MTLTRAQVVGLMVALLAAGTVLVLWPREEPGVEEAVRRRIVELTSAAERKEVGEIMGGVSERFRSGEGWSRQEVRGVLLARVLRGEWVRIFTTGLEVQEVSPTQGDFKVKFIFGRSQAEKLEDLSRDAVLNAYMIEGTFEKEEDGEWRVVKARHRPLGPTELF
jgi:hypothetical protein